MSLYEAIFTRRSVRSYTAEPLDTEVLATVEKLLEETEQIPGQHARFEIVTAEAISGTKAPYAVLAFCEDSDAAFANVGYVLHKADLHLQSIGIGSGWTGMAKPKAKLDGFCIALAFGNTDAPERSGEADFKRLPLEEISDADNTVAQAARLAPSAINSQPWKLHFEEGKVVVRYFGRGLTKRMLKKTNKIDVGIIARQIQVALEHEGKTVSSITAHSDGKNFEIGLSY
jgi:hypothetical protein